MKVYGWELELEKIRPVREDLFLALYGITHHHPELLLVIGELDGPHKELIKGIVIYGCKKR